MGMSYWFILLKNYRYSNTIFITTIKEVFVCNKSLFEQEVMLAIEVEIKKYFKICGINYNGEKDSIVAFFNLLDKLISPKPRKVFYSHLINEKIENNRLDENTRSLLDLLKERFENGEDMNGFLSKLVFDSEKPDYLRYIWGISHLHLSDKVAGNKEEMSSNRSDKQLLVIVENTEVLFVDVISHPRQNRNFEYFNLDTIRTIRDAGWIERIGFMDMSSQMDFVEGSLNPKISKAEEIYKLYKANVNLSFELDGKSYLLMNHITSSGDSGTAVLTRNYIIRNIRKIDSDGNKFIRAKLVATEDGKVAIIVDIETPNGNSSYNLLE